MFKAIILTLALVAATCLAGPLDDVDQGLREGAGLAPIEESYVSYDLHKDLHYFRDDYVDEAFSRKKYVDSKITLGGQARDMTGRQVPAAINPFAVGLKSLGKIGVSSDRWDVKENGKQQFAALYHGYNSNFVVNKLRANLLRRVINAVQSYLPSLDQAEAGDLEKYKETIFEEVSSIIETTMQEVDAQIKEAMDSRDDSSASATVVIVTEKFFIVANVGENNALAYNSMNEIVNLTPMQPGQNIADRQKNVFGAAKSKPGLCKPEVRIFPRFAKDEDDDDSQVHYILVESPLVGELVPDVEASKIVLSEIVQNRASLENEQKLYEDSISRLLQTASSRISGLSKAFFPELFQKSDYAALLIGLDRDYKNIH